MKILSKIGKWWIRTFEGNRCQFAKGCELYQAEGLVCNDLIQRFPTHEKAYCGRYRSMQEEEGKEKVE